MFLEMHYNTCHKMYKYQGVKEFHMLAHIGCYSGADPGGAPGARAPPDPRF